MATNTDDTPRALRERKPPAPCTMVIFGAGGDLTKRLLVPSLYNMAAAGALPAEFRLVGVDLQERTAEEWTANLRTTIESFAEDKTAEASLGDIRDDTWLRLTRSALFHAGDFTKSELFDGLISKVGDGNVIFYLAVAARFFGGIVDELGRAGMLRETPDRYRRVIIEKPFGHDLESARALDETILASADENQIFRIDHFLGKETVQSIMAVRFANGMFEPVWRREYIDHVQITAAETIGVEARAGFYDHTGALRDMVPNHLFNLLCMVAMESPNSLGADAVRLEKTKLLQAIRRIPVENCVMGQYGAGTLDGQALPGYLDEPGVAADSRTETYVAMKVEIENWRWGGVPFYLRTGKRMHARETEIAIVFRPAPFRMFADEDIDASQQRNVVRLMIDPEHGIRTEFVAKKPGPQITLAPVHSTFLYRDFFGEAANVGYETLIYDCMIGDPMLFQRADAIEACWSAVENLLNGAVQAKSYAAGSQGPDEADALLERDGRSWLPLGTLVREAGHE
ncbi:glucose-6-phosphate dehydrogenase [Tanticharoenia sakaeratensis]|uniref:Glucose-6-phosphate 1-dehydrogenase n=1 Tax=Tanticharoenia sakaeratensis NBRC 103193 TaxID=1231623 RepID=A0A0D6MIM7_9PROT|nr:glucose-6-phosphate dehydrogenase [Tanticharoenia sakaeratensis]GAN53300.1 glucose-6-phosphate 1-dehydrogenase [Tanticharoenia sakaeratensis NBRC 103193]GBQ21040.1 glucose-6-phosphate 1-dehydrogenase [Tanticharoenia sakaeratensis NBRC 103193]